MLEIEVKYPVADLTAIKERLGALGAALAVQRQDADRYFNAPDRDFAKTDEALRIRCIADTNRVTYKGPKFDKATKTRVEIEATLGAGAENADTFARLLTNLGYRPVETVRKDRTIYHLDRKGFALEICLDSVHGVGTFVELEIMAAAEALEAAKAVLHEVAGELGLGDSERRSYLELLLAKR